MTYATPTEAAHVTGTALVVLFWRARMTRGTHVKHRATKTKLFQHIT